MITERFSVFVLALSAFAAVLVGQDTKTEPEYVNQYFVLRDGKLDRLENKELKMQSKGSNHVISMKVTTSEIVDGTRSPIRVTPDAHSVVRRQTGDNDPATMIKLQSLKVSKNDREILVHSSGTHVFGGGHSNAVDDTSLSVVVKKYGANSFEVIPSRPLSPGEYFFAAGRQTDCFGVDAK